MLSESGDAMRDMHDIYRCIVILGSQNQSPAMEVFLNPSFACGGGEYGCSPWQSMYPVLWKIGIILYAITTC